MKFRPTDRELVRISDHYPHPRTSTYKPYKRPMDDEACDAFLQKLKANPVRTGVEWLMCPEPQVMTNEIKTVQDILSSKEFGDASDKKEFFLKV